MAVKVDTRGAALARPGLVGRLSDAVDAGSVLIVAAAGYGKSMVLQETLAERSEPTVWLSGFAAGGDAGRLLLSLVERLRRVVPGSADVFAEHMAAASQRLDVAAMARTLRGELEELLVEPVLVVLDDAEELEATPDAVAVVDILLHAEPGALRLAVASRRPLPLRVAKLRASGRLTELGAADLAFTPDECSDLLRERSGRAPSADEVDTVMSSTEGWPLGVALSALSPGHAGTSPEAGLHALASFVHEEVLDSLDPRFRAEVLASALPLELSGPVLEGLGLPADFPARAQRAGLTLRETHRDGRRWSYHPLLRDVLRARLEDERSEPELRALNVRVGDAIAASGAELDAVDHWLDGGAWEPALDAIERRGRRLARASPEVVEAWLERLPPEAADEPGRQLMLGQIEWGAGRHESAVEPFQAAIAGSDAQGKTASAWLGRLGLCDVLFSNGDFKALGEVSGDWENPALRTLRIPSDAVAWYAVLGMAAVGRYEDAQDLVARLRARKPARQLRYLDDLVQTYVAIPAGEVDALLVRLAERESELEGFGSRLRVSYALSSLAFTLMEIGAAEDAMPIWERCAAAAQRTGIQFQGNTAYWERAFILARAGRLAEAEAELERASRAPDRGWRTRAYHKARAAIALLRDDHATAVAAAERALDVVGPGPFNVRVWTACELAPMFGELGAPQLALDAVEAAREALDGAFPGASGRYHRARLLAASAWLHEVAGDVSAADADLASGWAQARGCTHHLVRLEWERIEALVGRALERGNLDPEEVTRAVERAFPGQAALVHFVDHPVADVRRAALAPAVASGHPAALARLENLVGDADEDVAAAARAARERVRRSPPALHFSLLGGFRARRASWELDDAAWGRPLAARLVRFLLVNRAAPVPEDVLFEAFWSDKPPGVARRSLAVAVSRARAALDVPAAESSVIRTDGRMYQLRLRSIDRVDAEDFDRAAAAGLGAAGPERLGLLEGAERLWGGEPLPEDLYVDWTTAWREELHERYAELLSALSHEYAAAGDTEQSIRVARKLVELDPLNEAAQRDLIVGYARAGRRSHALRQCLACRRVLLDELGVAPSEATAALQQRVLAGEPV